MHNNTLKKLLPSPLPPSLLVALAILPFFPAAPIQATYKDLMGYPELQALLGPNLPTGLNIPVALVEASESTSQLIYMPNTADGELLSKTIEDLGGGSIGTSSHATLVAVNFFGSSTAFASGVNQILVYDASSWVASFLRYGSNLKPLTSDARLANHSWIGNWSASNTDILRRWDYIVDEDDFIQVVGLPNLGQDNYPIAKSAFNVISVGLTNAAHIQGTVAVGTGEYTAGRIAPTLVTPGYNRPNSSTYTSWSTPIVSSAVAMLLEVAANPALSTGTITNRTRTINHAETSEVIKAVLMAGADRYVDNPRGADLTDYTPNTTNNLDLRYGAGQLNICNSYRILAAGEQDSRQDGRTTDIDWFGWDYDPAFGGASASNTLASYTFNAMPFHDRIIASLVWNIDVYDSNPHPNWFTPATRLYDLDLLLIDLTTGTTLASSLSTEHNTEHIVADLIIGHRYELQVLPKAGQSPFLWDYALAWQIIVGPALLGDFNLDGYVDDFDLNLLLSNWGLAVDYYHGNTDGLGVVDDTDLSILLSRWTGSPGPQIAHLSLPQGSVPEPATFLILLFSAACPCFLRPAPKHL